MQVGARLPPQEPLLSVRSLAVYHGQFKALHEVDVAVGEGEIVSLIGANGAGKSSLMKAIMGQVDRFTGSIEYNGIPLLGFSTGEIIAKGISMVPEGRRLFPSLSVEENLHIGWEVGRKGNIGMKEVFELFPVLKEKRRAKAGVLSGGQQQMVAFGRALLGNPRLLLCDELSLGLAPMVVTSLYEVVNSVKSSGTSILLVEQDVGRSLAVADRFYCLLEGKVTLNGRTSDASKELVMKHYFGS